MKNFCRKVIANLIILALVFTDFLPIGVGLISYAEEQNVIDYSVNFVELTEEKALEELKNENTEEVPLEGSSSVIFNNEDSSLLGVTEEEKIKEAEIEIEDELEEIKEPEIQIEETTNNEENLPLGPAIEVKIKVNGNGYLKNGKIEIKNYLSQMFEIREDISLDKNISSIVDNKIKLNQISNSNEVVIYIPINIKQEDKIDIESLQNGTMFNLVATYVAENGYEEVLTIAKSAVLNINNDYSINVNALMEKFIPFTDGEDQKALAQIKVIGGSIDTQVLPAKNASYEVEIPTIEGAEILDINVYALSTSYTNALADNEVQFSAENWEYIDGKVIITVDNNPVDGLYSKSTGNDEFIISYTYIGINEQNALDMKTKVTMKSEIFTSSGIVEKAVQNEFPFNAADASKSIITYEVSGKTKELSKGLLVGNLNNEAEVVPVEYENSLNINISRVELLKSIFISETDEYYEDEYGNKYPTLRQDMADSYYKQIVINKANLDAILGDTGTLELTTLNNESLFVINKDTPEAGDGFIRLSFGDSVVDKLNFIINNPKEDGILNITATKNIFKSSYDKTVLMNFKAIVAEYSAKATLDLDIETYMGATNVVTILKDTMTDAKITLNKDEFSTLVTNENVEITLALNNAYDDSDMYSNPVFEIVFPIEIKNVEVTDFNLLYGNEELSIKSVESLTNSLGQTILKVSLEGKQTKYTAGDSEDGTKVIIKANIDTDIYQASKNAKIIMNYYNEDATKYGISNEWAMDQDPTQDVILAQTGYGENPIKIVAPEGIVNAQMLSNYNGQRSVKSFKQGYKEDIIETFINAVIAKNTIISINNSGEDVEGYKILGRTSFVGNKKIVSEDYLGANITAPMVSKITQKNNANSFMIYYSENPDATEDLSLSDNGWMEEPIDIRNVKSYLIVALDTVKKGETLIFEYDFEIPENLPNNVDIVSSFATCNNKDSQVVWTEADKVLLTTGEAPLLTVETYSDTDVESALEGQILSYTTKVTNEGRVIAKNVVIENDIPEGTTYYKDGITDETLKKVTFNIPEIRPGESAFQTYEVIVNSIKTEKTETVIFPEAKVKADGLEEYIAANVRTRTPVKKSEISLDIDSDKPDKVIGENEMITYFLKISNTDALNIRNCEVEAYIPEGLEIIRAYEESYENQGVHQGDSGHINSSEGKIYWNIDNIGFYKIIKIEAKTRFIQDKTQDIPIKFTLKSKYLKNDYTSNEYVKTIGKPVLETKAYVNSNSKFVKEGDTVQFVLNMKNVGGIDATKLNLQNQIPEDFRVLDVSYINNGEKLHSLAVQNAEVNIDIPKDEETQIVVNCVANNLSNKETEKLTESSWFISGANFETTSTEKVEVIVEQNPEVPENTYEDVFASTVEINNVEQKYDVQLNEKEEEKSSKTFKIIGFAFEDLNKNGQIDGKEQVLENVVAKLCDAKTQKTIKQTVTNKAGEYVFDNLEKGEYYIKFEFDKDYYGITSYKKSGVRETNNSDAILSNGRAVTDKITIKDKSISDVNIGLVKTGLFDLEIDANINRIILFNDNSSISYNAENSKKAIFDFVTKKNEQMQSAVEYEIKVTNKGEIPGFASQIQCDLSERLALDETINPDWYYGNDGKVYSNTLGDEILNPGDSKTIKLYIYKDKNEVGLYANNFEISKTYNEYAIEDTNINNNKSSAEYVIEKVKGYNTLLVAMIISMTATILIVSLYMAKHFMESSAAKEYSKIEEKESK